MRTTKSRSRTETALRSRAARSASNGQKRSLTSFSFIRTLTVGSGVAPDLLTLPSPSEDQALAGLEFPPYRRWGVSPRPENECRTSGTTEIWQVLLQRKMDKKKARHRGRANQGVSW